MIRIKDPILERAEFMAETMKVHNVSNAILLILYDLCIPVKSDGFKYLRHILLIASQNPDEIVEASLFDEVRSLLAYKVSTRSIDTAIRESIKKAWDQRSDDRWSRYFPEYLAKRNKQPSNLEFISAIVYFLEFWQNCYEEETSYESA